MKIDSEELKARIKRELPLQGFPMSNSVVVYLLKIIREMEKENSITEHDKKEIMELLKIRRELNKGGE